MSLVELMVGILVGLLVVLAASGSMSFFEGQRKTSVSGNAAMNGGVMAGYLIQRDLRNAGVGLFNSSQFACAKLNLYYNGAVRADGSAVAPVQIVDGGAGPDAVTMFFSDSVLASAPVQLVRAFTSAADSPQINSSSGLQQGDVVLVASSNNADPCTAMQISGTAAAGTQVQLLHAASGGYPWNVADPAAVFTKAPLYAAGGAVLKAGSTLTWRRYSVNGGVLSATDLVTGNAVQVATGVVSLQAQYGITDGITTEIRSWVDATNEWTAPTPDLVTRIRAIRFSVIVRGDRKELANDGAGNCITSTVAPSAWPDVPPLDLSADPDWSCYHYQVYSSISPLKNVVWSVAQ
jgi:type IV pilus assembly protein PilW